MDPLLLTSAIDHPPEKVRSQYDSGDFQGVARGTVDVDDGTNRQRYEQQSYQQSRGCRDAYPRARAQASRIRREDGNSEERKVGDAIEGEAPGE